MEENQLLEKAEHRRLAVTLHNMVWNLLEKAERSRAEDEAMLYQAYASCFHWRYAGNVVHHQRGEWLISRVYVVLGRPEPALVHAQRCLELTQDNEGEMEDFDRAFAYQGISEAYALAGEQGEAERYREMAHLAGTQIVDEEDRKIFFDTLGDIR